MPHLLVRAHGVPVLTIASVEPLSASSLLTSWSPDPVALVVCTVAAVAYLAGVRRLTRRGRRWPVARSCSFAAAVSAICRVFATRLFAASAIRSALPTASNPAAAMARKRRRVGCAHQSQKIKLLSNKQ